MKKLNVNNDWVSNWIDSVNTSYSQFSVNNGIFNISGSTSNSAAYKSFWFPILPGMIIKVKFKARISGSTPLNTAKCSIDLLNADQSNKKTITGVNVNSKQWQQYEYKIIVPLNADQPFARITVGIYTSTIASFNVDYQDMSIEVENDFGSSIILAKGLLRIQNGLPDVHPSYPSFGIKSVSLKSGDNTSLLVTLSTPMLNTFRPLIFVSPSPETYYTPSAGTPDISMNTITVKWKGQSSGTNNYLDLSTANVYAFLKVEL